MDYPDFYSKGPAPCTKLEPEDFFPNVEEPNALKKANVAKKACAGCPYLEPCLEWAVQNNEPGIWGGTSENQRRVIRIKRAKESHG